MPEETKKETLKEFISFGKYLHDHPSQRFWQALRNWNMEKRPYAHFLLAASLSENPEMDFCDFQDTFAW